MWQGTGGARRMHRPDQHIDAMHYATANRESYAAYAKGEESRRVVVNPSAKTVRCKPLTSGFVEFVTERSPVHNIVAGVAIRTLPTFGL